jgi:hypothetical protein
METKQFYILKSLSKIRKTLQTYMAGQRLVDHTGQPEACGSYLIQTMQKDSFQVKLLVWKLCSVVQHTSAIIPSTLGLKILH